MKHLLITVASIFFATATQAQITVDINDMPIAKDSVVRYNATGFNALDFTTTGANTSWDYSALVAGTRVVDKHFDILQAPLFALATYGPFASANLKSQIWKDGQSPLNLGAAGTFINIDSTFEFYKKATNRYARTGYTIRLNGFDVPLPYDSNDVFYKLPMNFNDVDSGISVFEINTSFLSFLYYKTRQKRINYVDGWGELKLPNGYKTNVLKVKSELYAKDTVHIDTLFPFGFAINRPKTIEYKWLAKNMQAPILSVIGNEVGGTFTPTTVQFHYVIADNISDLNKVKNSINIYPNPANAYVTIQWNGTTAMQATVYNMQGQVQYSNNKMFPQSWINISGWSIGKYIIVLQNVVTKEKVTSSFVVE